MYSIITYGTQHAALAASAQLTVGQYVVPYSQTSLRIRCAGRLALHTNVQILSNKCLRTLDDLERDPDRDLECLHPIQSTERLAYF